MIILSKRNNIASERLDQIYKSQLEKSYCIKK